MWSYYGRKTKVVKYYPSPKYDTIIEPFAGTATYSLYGDNWKKKVILIEKYDKIYGIWKYLQSASEQDILALPEVEIGKSVNDYTFPCIEAKWLAGYCLNRGSAVPKLSIGLYSSWHENKTTISKNLYKIRLWDIRQGDYREIDNQEATWFIDPPYEFGGEYYIHGNKDMDFAGLREWCLSRFGQVIVCENTKATWMPFIPLKKMRGNKHVTTEAIWTNDSAFMTQGTMF